MCFFCFMRAVLKGLILEAPQFDYKLLKVGICFFYISKNFAVIWLFFETDRLDLKRSLNFKLIYL